jgi:hypothetical protein
LVELMVAVTGGLFVTMAVFVLSKQTTSVYQAESRISNATVGGVVGFERLRADIERAGYLASPNLSRDPKRCGMPDVTWPHAAGDKGQYLQHLSSVFITPTASTNVPPEITDNGIQPDEITLAGSYASNDQFPTGAIFTDANFTTVTLQIASPPMARLGFTPATLSTDWDRILSPVFAAGRILRIVDTAGGEQYGKIVKVDATGALPQILLATTNVNPLLYRGSNAAYKCGIQGNGDRSLVNVVNLVRYSLRNLSTNAQYAPLYDNGVTAGATQITAAAADSRRGELVREELDAEGTPIVDPVTLKPVLEVVTEFVVDLAFGLTVSQIVAPGGGTPVEQLATLAPGSAPIATWAGQTWGDRALTEASSLTPNTIAPQFVRSVHVRFGVRSREADRQAGMPTFGDGGTTLVMPGLYRVGLGAKGTSPFARVRTLQADIALRNHRGATWL